ncbi:MAG: metallophosphoesterase family protein [Verrucomicrobiota bacterium]
MNSGINRRTFLRALGTTVAFTSLPAIGQIEGGGLSKPAGKRPRAGHDVREFSLPPDLAPFSLLSLVLGRISGNSVTVSALARDSMEGRLEYGTTPGRYDHQMPGFTLVPGQPLDLVLDHLQPDTEYFYRVQCRQPGEAVFQARPECRFHTQRSPGRAFTFAIQGDSHPERPQMSDPELYARTLLTAAAGRPDFYLCMGDDFSVDTLQSINAETVNGRYLLQRPFLGLVGRSAPVFLVNGNHEQASLFNFNQPGLQHEVAVLAQNARNRFYPTPAPDAFYSGDTEPLKDIGLRKDYCAWTWGDALFVILDNYWHSPARVDNNFRSESANGGKAGHQGGGLHDGWGITLGNAQYQWFKRTLEQSRAKFKFVFAHHVLGTGRGGVDECDLFEWGGRNRRGDWEFARERPGWELPVHQLMVKHGVTIFFQGHDHLYCRQERDGVVYQEVPMPADPGYSTFNEDRYEYGLKLPNSGHLQVAVSPDEVSVDYVRSFLPKDESVGRKTGDSAHRYTIRPRTGHA